LPVCPQSSMLQQRRNQGIAAAKGAVEFHRVAGVAGAVDVFETRGKLRIKDIASLGKRGKSVGVGHYGPQDRVITGRVAPTREQVLEMRRTVAQSDLLWHIHPVEKCPLVSAQVEVFGGSLAMQFEVDQRCGSVFYHGEALVK